MVSTHKPIDTADKTDIDSDATVKAPIDPDATIKEEVDSTALAKEIAEAREEDLQKKFITALENVEITLQELHTAPTKNIEQVKNLFRRLDDFMQLVHNTVDLSVSLESCFNSPKKREESQILAIADQDAQLAHRRSEACKLVAEKLNSHYEEIFTEIENLLTRTTMAAQSTETAESVSNLNAEIQTILLAFDNLASQIERLNSIINVFLAAKDIITPTEKPLENLLKKCQEKLTELKQVKKIFSTFSDEAYAFRKSNQATIEIAVIANTIATQKEHLASHTIEAHAAKAKELLEFIENSVKFAIEEKMPPLTVRVLNANLEDARGFYEKINMCLHEARKAWAAPLVTALDKVLHRGELAQRRRSPPANKSLRETSDSASDTEDTSTSNTPRKH